MPRPRKYDENAEFKYRHHERKKNPDGRPLCKATTIHGTPCQQLALDDTGFCRHHRVEGRCNYRDPVTNRACESKRKLGADYCVDHLRMLATKSRQIIPVLDNRYLTYMPQNLAERVERVRQDRDLLSLRQDIELVTARVTQLLSGLDNRLPDFEMLQRLLAGLVDAHAEGDEVRFNTAAQSIQSVIQGGLSDSKIWDEVYSVIDHREKLVKHERDHLIKAGGLLAAEQVVVMLTRLLTVVTMQVQDPQKLTVIRNEYQRLLNLDNGQVIDMAP